MRSVFEFIDSEKFMAKQTNKDPLSYAILGSDHDMNLRFYERYDENFLFNKVATFLYIIDEGEPAIKQIEKRLMENGGGGFSERYLESIRAEIFFTALHQCETFFALLIAHYFTRNRTRGSDFPPFSPRMGGPEHRSPLLSYAFLATGKDGSSSLDGYDFS
jgi:hypothetical protein